MTPTFFGSSAWRRWKSAVAGNSSVRVSPSSAAGRASPSSEATGIERDWTAGSTVRCQASWSWLEHERRRRCGRAAARRLRAVRPGSALGCAGSRASGSGAGLRAAGPLLELLEPKGERLAREVGAGARHLHERELERQARVAALAHVVDGDREQVAEPQHRRLRQLVRLLAQPLARLVGDGQRVGHVPHVLDEQQVAEVLEQVDDEAAEILALLGELLD